MSAHESRSSAGPRRRVLVTGATGYVGRHVVPHVFEQGFAVRALVRGGSNRSAVAEYTEDFHEGDVTDAASLAGACEGCCGVVHLVGVINEKQGSFDAIHIQGTRNVVAEAQRAGCEVFVYLSGLGARVDPNAGRYHQTKDAAERIVAESGMRAYNFPASVIFGPEDEFLNLFVGMARSMLNPPWPIMPAIAGGHSYLQPVWVEDVAEVLARALREDFPFPPASYELGGPQPLKVREIERIACRCARASRILVPIPMWKAKIIAFFMETFMSKPLLTLDQLKMLQEDGRCKMNMTEKILGRPARSLWDYACEQFGLGERRAVAVGAATYTDVVRPQERILWRPEPPKEEKAARKP
ncbi:MAG: NAD(P)H-binding protein [Planctomycetota bacterium]|nr:NAD(P)H-binding protein [Planctomycetota bacterium]